jgi:hypothetical protein
MPETPLPPKDPVTIKTLGGPIGIHTGRLSDAVSSQMDPDADLHSLYLPWPAWTHLLGQPQATRLDVLKAMIALESARAFAAGQPKNAPAAAPLTTLLQAGISLWKDVSAAAKSAPALAPVSERLDAFVDKHVTLGVVAKLPSQTLDQTLTRSANWALALAKGFAGMDTSGVDLREAWWEIRDQERTASCVGWALSDLLWLQTDGTVDVPSARYIWTGAKELDTENRPTTFIAGAGVSLRAGLDLVRSFGCALDSEVPSNSAELFRGSTEEFYGRVGKRKIAGIMDLRGDSNLWLAWLATQRPIVCAILANRDFARYRGGSNSFQSFDPSEPGMFPHAVVIAGWRIAPSAVQAVGPMSLSEAFKVESTDPAASYPIEYLVRNCAGRDWGDQGYAYIPHHIFAQMCAEAYGVLMTPAEVKDPGLKAVRRWWDDPQEVVVAPRASTKARAQGPRRIVAATAGAHPRS